MSVLEPFQIVSVQSRKGCGGNKPCGRHGGQKGGGGSIIDRSDMNGDGKVTKDEYVDSFFDKNSMNWH